MKVYVVMEEIPYEGFKILHICSSLEAAETAGQRSSYKWNMGGIDIEEWEVED